MIFFDIIVEKNIFVKFFLNINIAAHIALTNCALLLVMKTAEKKKEFMKKEVLLLILISISVCNGTSTIPQSTRFSQTPIIENDTSTFVQS